MRLIPSAPPPPATHRRPTVLVVDDESLNLLVAHQCLKADHEVLGARSVTEALQVATQHRPDLILLDVAMPDISGLDGCDMFKALPGMRDVPVIFVTARTSPEQEVQCLDAGGADFICKPINPPVLKARVKTQLTVAMQSRALREMAYIDPLTGLYNRRTFDAHIGREFLACRREEVPLGIVMLDVDCFKAYNDHYGHQAGDEALVSVARVLQDSLRRPRDFLARYGGEEMICVVPNSNIEETMAVAEHLRCNVDDAQIPHDRSTVSDHVTVSIGVASWIPCEHDQEQTLVSAADASLYEAKARGRNQVFSLPPSAV